MNRRRFMKWSAIGTLAGIGSTLPGVGAAAPRRIPVKATKFEFTPAEIRLRKGEPVVFELSAEDFPHGFSLPDFKVRRDFVPGKTLEFAFAADRSGRFPFLCDNFCGDGHDNMSGWLIVSES